MSCMQVFNMVLNLKIKQHLMRKSMGDGEAPKTNSSKEQAHSGTQMRAAVA